MVDWSFFFFLERERKGNGKKKRKRGERPKTETKKPAGSKKNESQLSLFLSTLSLLLTVVIQSKVAAEFAGAFLSAPEVSSSGASCCEFFAPLLPVENAASGRGQDEQTDERARGGGQVLGARRGGLGHRRGGQGERSVLQDEVEGVGLGSDLEIER